MCLEYLSNHVKARLPVFKCLIIYVQVSSQYYKGSFHQDLVVVRNTLMDDNIFCCNRQIFSLPTEGEKQKHTAQLSKQFAAVNFSEFMPFVNLAYYTWSLEKCRIIAF